MWCTWSWCGWYWGCKDVEDVVWIKWKVDFGSSSLGKTLCRSFPCPLPQEAASCRVRIFRLSVSPRLVPWPRRHPSTSFHRPDIWRCKDDIGTIISRQWNDWLQRRFVHVCCFCIGMPSQAGVYRCRFCSSYYACCTANFTQIKFSLQCAHVSARYKGGHIGK